MPANESMPAAEKVVRALLDLPEDGTISAVELAKEHGVEHSTASKILRILTALEWIVRREKEYKWTRSRGRPQICYMLTPEGRIQAQAWIDLGSSRPTLNISLGGKDIVIPRSPATLAVLRVLFELRASEYRTIAQIHACAHGPSKRTIRSILVHYISEEWVESRIDHGVRPQYYRLTQKGRAALREEKRKRE